MKKRSKSIKTFNHSLVPFGFKELWNNPVFFFFSSARTSIAFLQWFYRYSIWWSPVSIEDFLKLWNNGRLICPKANACCGVKVVPHQVAGAYVCTHITNCIFTMINPCIARIHIPSGSTIKYCRSSWIVSWNNVIFDLNFTRTVVVLWRRA